MRNSSTGNIDRISGIGGRMLNWLSIYYNFTLVPYRYIARNKLFEDNLFIGLALTICRYSPLQVTDDIGFDDIENGFVGFIQRDVLCLFNSYLWLCELYIKHKGMRYCGTYHADSTPYNAHRFHPSGTLLSDLFSDSSSKVVHQSACCSSTLPTTGIHCPRFT